jgi:hypothetical protein
MSDDEIEGQDRRSNDARSVSPPVSGRILKFTGLTFAHVLQVIILIIGILELSEELHWWGYESLLFVIVISTPFISGRLFKIVFPWGLTVILALSLFLHCAGNYFGYYWSLYPYYDKFVHVISAVLVASVALVGIGLFERQPNDALKVENHNVPLVLIVSALIMGAAWELVEFVFDITLGTVIFTLQHGIWDTSLDMVADCMGGVVVAAYSVVYLKKHAKKDLVIDRPDNKKQNDV